MHVISSMVAVEFVGDRALAVNMESGTAYTLSHNQSIVLRAIQHGEPVDEADEAVCELLELGLIVGPKSSVSRRSVLAGGAAAIGGAAVTLVMPSVAMASSTGGSCDSGGDVTGTGSLSVFRDNATAFFTVSDSACKDYFSTFTGENKPGNLVLVGYAVPELPFAAYHPGPAVLVFSYTNEDKGEFVAAFNALDGETDISVQGTFLSPDGQQTYTLSFVTSVDLS